MTRSPTPSRRMRSSAAATVIPASSSGKSFRACSTMDEVKSGILTASLTAYLYAMNDAFAAKNVGGFAEVIAHVRLLPDPIKITPDARGEIDLRRISRRADAFRVAGEMPHLAGTKFVVHFRRDPNVERVGDLLGDFPNADTFTAADVNRQAIELVAFGGEQIRACDVFHE